MARFRGSAVRELGVGQPFREHETDTAISAGNQICAPLADAVLAARGKLLMSDGYDRLLPLLEG